MNAGTRKYGWALRIPNRELQHLSQQARNGVLWAQQLARNRQQRRELALTGHPPTRLTIKELASQDWQEPREITAALRQARIELFGKDLSDSAAYRRTKQSTGLEERECSHPGCTTILPAYAHASRRYCGPHRTAQERVKRHRDSAVA